MTKFDNWLSSMVALVYVGGVATLIFTAMGVIDHQNRIERRAKS